MAIFIALLFALLLWRVLSLQVLDTDRGYEFLQNQGEARFVRTAVIPAYRGVISDRRGEPLAVSTPVISLVANPQLLDASGRAGELALALKMKPAQLARRLEQYQGRQFMYLRRHMAPADARPVLQLQFPGVRGEREYQRYYPAGEVAAHLVGFTNLDDRGIEGMELAYESSLRGSPGRKQVIKDRYGEVVRDIGVLESAQSGQDISLSIDLRLQYLAHRELQRTIALTGAKSGSVVTIDTRSGEVLAMVSHPVYNPNNRKNRKPQFTRNRALVDSFEPGSTMKPLAVVAALESGLFSPTTLIDTSPGRIKVGRKVLLDPVNYGEISVSKVVAKSSQVGIVKMTLQLDEQSVWQVFNKFGLGQNPGTGFPGEGAGALPYRQKWRPIERVTLAYGYGLTATPLQLALAYSVLANRGFGHPASLLRLDADEVVNAPVVEPRLALQVLQMLEGVTEKGGTARRAQVPGYRVGGKTGTAHIANSGGYADDRYVALFAGIAPVSNPRLVTVVLISEPQHDNYHGGEVAAPVFSRITAGALRLLNVAPDRREDAGAV